MVLFILENERSSVKDSIKILITDVAGIYESLVAESFWV